MSKNTIIIKCEACGKELVRKEEGESRNPNGVITSNRQIFTVNYTRCSHCNPKDKR